MNNDKAAALLDGSRRKVNVLQDNHLRVGIHDSSFKGHDKIPQGLHWRYSVYGEAYWPNQSFSTSRDEKN